MIAAGPACLEMGHIPVGMEMFSAADEEQWQIIMRHIDESDYYVVIVAQRYGSVIGDITYTEKEYDYAVKLAVPTLGFILQDGAPWPTDRLEPDDSLRATLQAFKSKVKQKPVNFWSSKDELYAKCAIALGKSFTARPRPGWIRAPKDLGPEVAAEISRLSNDNAVLRKELEALTQTQDTSHFSQGDDAVTLTLSLPGERPDVALTTTWNNLFSTVARACLSDLQNNSVFLSFIDLFKSQNEDVLWLTSQTLDSIKTHFIALDLISIEHDSQVNNTTLGARTTVVPLWKLTPIGQRLYARLAAMRRLHS